MYSGLLSFFFLSDHRWWLASAEKQVGVLYVSCSRSFGNDCYWCNNHYKYVSWSLFSWIFSFASWLSTFIFELMITALFCRNCERPICAIVFRCMAQLFCYSLSWGRIILDNGLFPFLWCCSSNCCASITGKEGSYKNGILSPQFNNINVSIVCSISFSSFKYVIDILPGILWPHFSVWTVILFMTANTFPVKNCSLLIVDSLLLCPWLSPRLC